MRVATLFLFSAAIAVAATPGPAPETQQLFHLRCAGCHGMSGEGGVGPSFKQKLHHSTVPQIMAVIKNGIPGTAMPASAQMPDPTVRKLAQYVQYLNRSK